MAKLPVGGSAFYVTLDQARAFVEEVNRRGIGGGVAPETDDDETSGIFLPSWTPQPGAARLGTAEAWLYLLRFKSGVTGFEIGMWLDKLKRFPLSQEYVWGQLRVEHDRALSDMGPRD